MENKKEKDRSLILKKMIQDIFDSKKDDRSKFEEKLYNSRDEIIQRIDKTKHNLTDAYGNRLLGIGKEDKKKDFGYWDLSNDVNN